MCKYYATHDVLVNVSGMSVRARSNRHRITTHQSEPSEYFSSQNHENQQSVRQCATQHRRVYLRLK